MPRQKTALSTLENYTALETCVAVLMAENAQLREPEPDTTTATCAGNWKSGVSKYTLCDSYPQVFCRLCKTAFCALCDKEFHFGKDPLDHPRRFIDNSQQTSIKPCVFKDHPRHLCQRMGTMNCDECAFTSPICSVHMHMAHAGMPYMAKPHIEYRIPDDLLFPSKGFCLPFP